MRIIKAIRALFAPKPACCWQINPDNSHIYDSYCACCEGDCERCNWLGYYEEGN